jgi:hypothetical protein
MKGILHKTESGWIVIYDQILGEGIIKRNQNSLPLHPEFQTILPLDLDLEGGEVEFDWCVIVEHDTGKGKEYAKLITPKQSTTPSQTFIMKDKDGVFYELPTKEDTTEISDEEIEEASRQINYGGGSEGWIKDAFIKGAKWYREQIK